MGWVRCRSCKAEIEPDGTRCPACGAEHPVEYLCFVCRAPVPVGEVRSTDLRGPFGFTWHQTDEGQPLCARHALVECNLHGCRRRCRADQLAERVIGWQAKDLSGVEQYVPVKGYLCPFCNAEYTEPDQPALPLLKRDTLEFLLRIMVIASILSVMYCIMVLGFVFMRGASLPGSTGIKQIIAPVILPSLFGIWVVALVIALIVWATRKVFRV